MMALLLLYCCRVSLCLQIHLSIELMAVGACFESADEDRKQEFELRRTLYELSSVLLNFYCSGIITYANLRHMAQNF